MQALSVLFLFQRLSPFGSHLFFLYRLLIVFKLALSGLDIGQGDINFGMFELVVLVETAL